MAHVSFPQNGCSIHAPFYLKSKSHYWLYESQLLLVAMTIGIVLIGLIILKVEHALVIALCIGLVDLLPYIGSGTVFLPWIIYSAMTGNLSLAIGLGILYIVVLIQRQISEPKVLSKSIGLNPLATLVALFVGLKWFGFLGLVIGPASLVVWQAFRNAGVFRDIYEYIRYGMQNKRDLQPEGLFNE